jgi:hypothetical protein
MGMHVWTETHTTHKEHHFDAHQHAKFLKFDLASAVIVSLLQKVHKRSRQEQASVPLVFVTPHRLFWRGGRMGFHAITTVLWLTLARMVEMIALLVHQRE